MASDHIPFVVAEETWRKLSKPQRRVVAELAAYSTGNVPKTHLHKATVRSLLRRRLIQNVIGGRAVQITSKGYQAAVAGQALGDPLAFIDDHEILTAWPPPPTPSTQRF